MQKTWAQRTELSKSAFPTLSPNGSTFQNNQAKNYICLFTPKNILFPVSLKPAPPQQLYFYLLVPASCSILSYPVHSSTPFWSVHTHTEPFPALGTKSSSCPEPQLLSQCMQGHQAAPNPTLLSQHWNLHFSETNFDFSVLWNWASSTKFLAIYFWDPYKCTNKRI